MPQNVAHAFLPAVSLFVATSLGTGIPGGPGFLRLCPAGWDTQAKSPARVPPRQAETLRHALPLTRRLRRQLFGASCVSEEVCGGPRVSHLNWVLSTVIQCCGARSTTFRPIGCESTDDSAGILVHSGPIKVIVPRPPSNPVPRTPSNLVLRRKAFVKIELRTPSAACRHDWCSFLSFAAGNHMDELTLRPPNVDSYPVSVRQVAVLFHASSRPRLTATPLRFPSTSLPSSCAEDLHLLAVKHARHTT